MGETVYYHRSVSMTIDEEISLSNKNCSPRECTGSWYLSEDLLRQLEEMFETYTGLQVEKLLPALDRRLRAGLTSAMVDAPFVWALQHIKSAMARNRINLDDFTTNAALTRALLFGSMARTWDHHPRFGVLAKEFSQPKSFYHTVGLCLFANYLFNAGNRITFSVEDVPGKPKPDLYLRLSSSDRLFVEFKAPTILTWTPAATLTKEAVTKKVREILNSGRQINRQNPGVIAIMINHPSILVARDALLAAEKFMRIEGRRRSSLAAAAIMHCPGVSRNRTMINVAYEVQTALNPHWERGPNPVAVTIQS